MNSFIVLLFFIIFVSMSQGAVNDNCVWKYKCCEYSEDRCVKLCDPQIECKSEEEEPFMPFQVMNVKCKFGYKSDSNQKCRQIF